jgi:hypothetical protein
VVDIVFGVAILRRWGGGGRTAGLSMLLGQNPNHEREPVYHGAARSPLFANVII